MHLRNVNALGFTKDSEFTDCFNFHISALMETGIVELALKDWDLTGDDGKNEHGSSVEIEEDARTLGFYTLMLPVLPFSPVMSQNTS